MTAFQEAVLGTDGKVKFIYNYNETTGTGIVPVTYVEKTEAGGSDDQYTYFHSSNTKLIQSGIPRLVGKPVYNTKVVVDSYLSSDVYGKYYTKYMELRKKDGCAVVDMECASVMAVGQFRGKEVYEFLYAADCLDNSSWDKRILGEMPDDMVQ